MLVQGNGIETKATTLVTLGKDPEAETALFEAHRPEHSAPLCDNLVYQPATTFTAYANVNSIIQSSIRSV